MLPTRTVFVIGAGASQEVSLPLGDELKEAISQKLDFRLQYGLEISRGDKDIFYKLQDRYRNDTNSYIQASREISAGIVLSPSIDDYINIHKDNEMIAICGKLAIAKSILDAERKSKLYINKNSNNDSMNFSLLSKTWYTGFFQYLVNNNVLKSNLESIFENLVLIVFNYDRCIEHFLVHAISNTYQVTLNEASNLVKSLKIYRPYGSVGDYFKDNVPFGSDILPSVEAVTNSLKTYCEEIENTNELTEMRKAVDSSLNIIFLGNAYHPNNMNLLFDESLGGARSVSPKRIFATRHGVFNEDLKVVQRWFNRITNYKIAHATPTNHYFAQTCNDLFIEYRMSLRS